MARTDFPAGLVTVLAATNGGELYWFFRVTPSGTPGPTNKFIVAGNIRTTSFTDTTVLADRLLDISDLDIRGNPLQDALAKVADVKIKIQNITAGIDFDDFNGRVVEVFVGSGTTMSTATAAVMFTGKIKNVATIRDIVTFTARGFGELRNKEVGERTGEEVNEKFRGQIFPIAHGNWTGANDWLPAIPNRPIKKHPEMIFDNQNWKDFESLWIYDTETRVGYRAKLDVGTFIINSGNFQIAFILDTLTTIAVAVGGIPTVDLIELNDSTKINYEKFGLSGSVAEPTILKIDDEYMYVWEDPATTGSDQVRVERGFLGTTIATHDVGATVFQMSGNLSKFLILMAHTFFAEQVSGSQVISTLLDWTIVQPTKTDDSGILGIQDNDDSMDWEVETFSHPGTLAGSQIHALSFIFPEIGITGTVLKQYWLAKLTATLDLSNSDRLDLDVGLIQGGDSGNTFLTFNANQGRAVSIDSLDFSDPFTAVFNNVDFAGVTGSATANSASILTDSAAGFVVAGVIIGMAILNKTTGARSHIKAVTATTCTTTIAWSTSDLYEICTETMIELTSTGSYVLDAIENLSTKRYDIGLVSLKSGSLDPINGGLGKYEFKINRFGFRIEFNASPFENDFWAKAEARKHPGSYFNGTINTLMEAPSIIIEDFLRRDVDDISATDLEESFFDAFHVDRTAWKLATVIYTRQKNPTLRDVLKFYLENSGGMLFERFDGKMAVISLDDPGSVSRTITDPEIEVDRNNVAIYSYNFTSANDLITRIDLKNNWIVPLDDEFDAVKFAQRTGAAGEQNNFNFLDEDTNTGEFYSGLLQEAHNVVGEERPFTFESEAIRDEETAERLARILIKWRHKQLVILTLECTYSVLNIEWGDKIGISSSVLPSFLTSKRWQVIQATPTVSILNKKPKVKLSLIEIPLSDSAPPAVCEVLTDTAAATVLTDTAGAEALQDTACN